MQTFNGQTKRFEIAPRLAEHLQDLSRRSGTSLFMTLYAAFAVLLSRYSGQGDIVVGTSIANRHYQELEPLIGFFVNTLALRTELSENPRFDELLQQVRQVTLDAYAHQDIPFEQLAEELDVERSLSHPPLFQVMFELQNAVSEPTGLGDLHVKSLDVGNVTAKFDLNVMLYEGDPTSGGG
ncbi:non-ribosomal peptide synthetase, partial [Candidatus Entotheonella serta]